MYLLIAEKSNGKGFDSLALNRNLDVNNGFSSATVIRMGFTLLPALEKNFFWSYVHTCMWNSSTNGQIELNQTKLMASRSCSFKRMPNTSEMYATSHRRKILFFFCYFQCQNRLLVFFPSIWQKNQHNQRQCLFFTDIVHIFVYPSLLITTQAIANIFTRSNKKFCEKKILYLTRIMNPRRRENIKVWTWFL